MITNRDWWTTAELGEATGRTAETIVNAIRRGYIRAVRIPGCKRSRYRIPDSEVQRILAQLEDRPDA
jgi:excisionase family DNA binding protein